MRNKNMRCCVLWVISYNLSLFLCGTFGIFWNSCVVRFDKTANVKFFQDLLWYCRKRGLHEPSKVHFAEAWNARKRINKEIEKTRDKVNC